MKSFIHTPRTGKFAGILNQACMLAYVSWFVVVAASAADDQKQASEFIQSYCLDCHNADDVTGGLDLESMSLDAIDETQWPAWELSLKRIASHQMPPPDADRPDLGGFTKAVDQLAAVLDRYADEQSQIPEVPSLRRLTRTEYENSIRDLLDVTIDAKTYLPKDESSQGFDNITVGELSPLLLSRYLTAAEEISRKAVGGNCVSPSGITVRLPADLTQERRIEGLPLGTRGGTRFTHTFESGGQYEFALRLTRDRDEMIEGLFRPHDLDILIDGQRRHRFEIKPPERRNDDTNVDANLRTRIGLTPGPHEVVVTFASQGESLLEIKRQPFDAAYNRHRHPRQQPALFEVSIVGPLDQQPNGRLGLKVTASRQAIFTSWPKTSQQSDQLDAAKAILTRLARRAFRRPVSDSDLESMMRYVRDAIQSNHTSSTTNDDSESTWESRFELGIQRAIASILVNPNFLFRIEKSNDNASAPTGLIGQEELATRLSYFLWSSLPDDRLLTLAEQKRLTDPEVLSLEVERMLADPRSASLVTNFASQWLYLRNLDGVKPDLRKFPSYDENLRRACRRETELFVLDVIERDASVLEWIQSDFTFLNERLARHYAIPGILGSHFRKVPLPPNSHRGGLLRQASILSVTSYATRTSPTIRGNWVLENIIGTPPPPPPPDVPTLKEKSALTAETFRERLALHRQNPACASCHALIDPVGFSLDHYDAIGQFRTYDGDSRVDAAGVLPDGSEVSSVSDLEQSILDNPRMFVTCLTEKLMTYALGRGVDHRDASSIRRIVRGAELENYRFSALIQGIVASRPFQFRQVSANPNESVP